MHAVDIEEKIGRDIDVGELREKLDEESRNMKMHKGTYNTGSGNIERDGRILLYVSDVELLDEDALRW